MIKKIGATLNMLKIYIVLQIYYFVYS